MCQKVKQADSAYIAGTYGRFDAVMSKGEGAHYEGPDGKRYIDFGTGIGVTLFGACAKPSTFLNLSSPVPLTSLFSNR